MLNKFAPALVLAALAGAAPAAWANTGANNRLSARSITDARYKIERFKPQLELCEEAVETGATLPDDFKPVYKAPSGLEIEPELLSMPVEDLYELNQQTLHEIAVVRSSLQKCLRKYKKLHGEWPWE